MCVIGCLFFQMMQLGRFKAEFKDGELVNRKLHTRFRFNHQLDMAPYTEPSCKDTTSYTLVGVLIHSGETSNSGHYFSYARRGDRKSDWWK